MLLTGTNSTSLSSRQCCGRLALSQVSVANALAGQEGFSKPADGRDEQQEAEPSIAVTLGLLGMNAYAA
jgi:hypothetical protein